MATPDELRALKEDWDSYGAKPIDPRCVDKAQLFNFLLNEGWDLVPVCDGGVDMEKREDGLEIIISISPLPEGDR